MPDLFLSPHNDDAALFGAFIIRARRPLVITVYDSFLQFDRGAVDCTAETRRLEDISAMQLLNPGSPIQFLGLDDRGKDDRILLEALVKIRDRMEKQISPADPTTIWIPAPEKDGHRQHNAVAWHSNQVLGALPGVTMRSYMTYTAAGRSTSEEPVPFEANWVRLKLLALACYRTQILHRDNCEHFTRPLVEYYGPAGEALSR